MQRPGENTQTNQTQIRAFRSSASQHLARRQERTRRAYSLEYPPRRSDGESNDEEEDNAQVSSVLQDAQVVSSLHEPPSLPSDDDFSSQSNVVETRARKRTHINLEVPANSHGDTLSGDIRRPRTGGLQVWGSNLGRRPTPIRGYGPSWLGSNPALSKKRPQHPNRRLYQTLQVPHGRANYRASSGNDSLSPMRIFSFTMQPNFIYRQKFYMGQPWPSAAVMENMIERAWALALEQRKREKEEYYRSGDRRPPEQAPSLLPDAVSLEILVSEARKIVVEWYKLPIVDPVECRTLVNNLLKDDLFLSQTVDLRDGPRTSWFMVEEIVKLVRAYFFANERSLGCKSYTQEYFSPLRWPTVLLVCTALCCSLIDYEDTGHKSLAVGDFSQAVFGEYYKRYYQTYQKMSDARKKATIRKIDRCMQKIRSQHETERRERAGYEDEMGDDVRDLIESDDNT